MEGRGGQVPSNVILQMLMLSFTFKTMTSMSTGIGSYRFMITSLA